MFFTHLAKIIYDELNKKFVFGFNSTLPPIFFTQKTAYASDLLCNMLLGIVRMLDQSPTLHEAFHNKFWLLFTIGKQIMANNEQLNLLKTSVVGWNAWREANPDAGLDETIDLHSVNLCNINLSGVNLSGADLSYSNIDYANLSGANLSNAILHHTNLVNANLTGADLTGADLHSTTMNSANLTNANLTGADLQNATLNYATMNYANLTDANLTGADLRDTELRGTDFTNANMDSVVNR